MSGWLYGVGVGPGDPELLTLKALRIVEAAPVIAHFAKAGRPSHARAVVAGRIRPGTVELSLPYPVTTEIDRDHGDYRSAITAFFDQSAARVAAHLDAGRDVAVLSEGDPFFYGSYLHLHVRLADRYPAEVVPGVTGMSACWSLGGEPLVSGDEVLAVLPSTLPEAELAVRLQRGDGAVLMKLGRNLPKVRRALAEAGRLDRAIYVERGTMPGSRVVRLADKSDDEAPYFAVVLVPCR
ncbi:MAG TPA: precorrin-2 C(20)-methyltransferase [Geminicoccaceae bacterium]|nr:precorrin-2 C(20)-methyltransferase [Geminicoccus sp.]HMU51753.1 precorrin-2 C(20)-methyltransferase [Geminicoccaceae bacterium]